MSRYGLAITATNTASRPAANASNEQEREDQRERPDQQEHQEQPRSQHEDDGRAEKGWGPDDRCPFVEHFAPRGAVRRGGPRRRGDADAGLRIEAARG